MIELHEIRSQHEEAESKCPVCLAKTSQSAPLDTCSWLSVLIMKFMSPLLALGYRKPLTIEDIPLLPGEDDLPRARERFLQNWTASRASGNDSILLPIIKTVWRRWIFAAVVLFLATFASLATPFIITDFVRTLEHSCQDITHAMLDAVGLFMAGTLTSLLTNNAYYNNVRVAGVVREALMAAIYKKSLVLSQSARMATTTGRTVNLMSSDAQRVYEAFLYVHYIWLSPLVVITVCAVLIYEIGLAALYGTIVLLALVPLQWLGTVLAARYRRAMLRHTDHRIMFTSEMLSGIRIIKQYAWEKPVGDKVADIRAREVADLWKLLLVNNLSVALFNVWPAIVTALTFIIFVLEGNTLTPTIVFMIMALFVAIRFPISMIQKAIQIGTDALVSLRRIGSFLSLQELNYSGRILNSGVPGAISIQNASFSYDASSQAPILRNIALDIDPGALVAVIGPVASGKSSLLSAILGEIQVVSGSISVSGSIAYTSQHHWIRNLTVRENILFGKEFDEEKYNAVLAASALIQDLSILPSGDLTEIGEQGINLSGGQKARIMFARACYADADIALLDDPFSAVDVDTGNIMFQYGIKGLFSKATRVITLNSHLHFLNNVDVIIYLRLPEGEGDTIVESYKSYAEFSKCHPNFVFVESKTSEERDIAAAVSRPLTQGSLVERELEQIGSVRPRVYLEYLAECSMFGAFFAGLVIFVSFLVGQLLRVGTDLVSGFWSQVQHPDQNWWMLLQIAFAVAALIAFVGRSFIFNNMTIRACQVLHDNLFKRILTASVPTFYDVTPVGRIVNRFSKDMDQIDVLISDFLGQLLLFGLTLGISVILSCFAVPWFTIPLVPILAFFYWAQLYFRYSSRQLKRIEGTSRSPIFSKFEETLRGVATIRAHRKQSEFIHEVDHSIERNSQALLSNQLAGRWLALRLDLVSNFVILGVAVAIASVSCSVDLALGIVALVQTTQLTGMLQWTVRVSTEVENNMTAVERVLEYTEVPSEAPEISKNDPDESWPSMGEIIFTNLRARYRPELPLVLKGISAHIRPMEKVGICGRTGSGKSSLLLCLLRIIERDPSGGQITIDNIPIDTIGLHCLRSRISVIPQDAVLFSGTIRQNLDPFNQRTDDEVIEALRQVSLISDRSNLSLGDIVAERGSSLSFGQRQLICIARAFLRRSKIIICDEATSGIDSKTDKLIQTTIRLLFKTRTVITVAHRLETIADSDRIMVIREGVLQEFDTPRNLIDKPDGYFRMMVESGGKLALERFKTIIK